MKVSVIVPIYNVEQYIDKCLKSLLAQSLKEIEIICIDDGGTDKSVEIAKKYQAKDSRITLIHNETNIGVGPSRNKGIKAATGEYIGFVDPDDWVDKDFFEKLYEKAVRKNLDLAKAESKYVYPSGNIVKSNLNSTIKKELKLGMNLCSIFYYEFTTALYKKELILNNRIEFPNIKKSQDTAFLLQAAYKAKNIDFVRNTYYYYLQRDSSSVRTFTKERFEATLDWAEYCCKFLNEIQLDKKSYIKRYNDIFKAILTDYTFIRNNPSLSQYKKNYTERIISFYLLCKHSDDFDKLYKYCFIEGFKTNNSDLIIKGLEEYTKNTIPKNNSLKELINKIQLNLCIRLKK